MLFQQEDKYGYEQSCMKKCGKKAKKSQEKSRMDKQAEYYLL